MNRSIKITLTILVLILLTLVFAIFVPWKSVFASMQNLKVYSQEHMQTSYEQGVTQGEADKITYESDISAVKQRIQDLIQKLNEIKASNLIEEKNQQDLLNQIQQLMAELDTCKEPNYVDNKIAEINALIDEADSKISALQDIFANICVVQISAITLNENNQIVEKDSNQYFQSTTTTSLINLFINTCNVFDLTSTSVKSDYITLHYISVKYPNGIVQDYYSDKSVVHNLDGTTQTYGATWKSALSFAYPLQKVIITSNYTIL